MAKRVSNTWFIKYGNMVHIVRLRTYNWSVKSLESTQFEIAANSENDQEVFTMRTEPFLQHLILLNISFPSFASPGSSDFLTRNHILCRSCYPHGLRKRMEILNFMLFHVPRTLFPFFEPQWYIYYGLTTYIASTYQCVIARDITKTSVQCCSSMRSCNFS